MPRQFGKRDESVRWPKCTQCGHKHEPGSDCPPTSSWAGTGMATPLGVVWLKRPMPDGQWPPDLGAPRNDEFLWWVKSACGHPGGHRQWAFYREADADQYEGIFLANPCHYTGCARSKTRRR